MKPKGIIIRSSPWSVKETIDRLVVILEDRKAIVYARINQQSKAHNVGKEIPPLEFILFGNPKAGGLIMTENPIAALDLPLKIIAWQDAVESVWVAYNSASYLEQRYALSHDVIMPADLDPLINSIYN